jgi:hypothetical protein
MRYVTLGAVLCVGIGTAVRAQSADPQVLAPINAFLGDMDRDATAGRGPAPGRGK